MILKAFTRVVLLGPHVQRARNDMSRKLRSSEMIEQLGEPLPLPYLTDKKPKNEGTDESPEVLSNPASDLKRRKVRIPSGPGFQSTSSNPGSSNTKNNGDAAISTRIDPVFPLRLLRQTDLELPEETILDELERKIALMKQDINSSKDLEQDLAALQDISKTLDDIHNRKNNDNILHELERLQYQGEQFKKDSTHGVHWLIIVVVTFVLLLVASFLAGQFSYEYCYYFC